MAHTRGAPYHPMTQGKIERYHRSMKNIVKLQNYYFPWELEHELSRFVDYYNNHRYHESLNNVTPADVYFGRKREILTKRDQIKRKTLALRRKQNLKTRVASLELDKYVPKDYKPNVSLAKYNPWYTFV